MPAPEIVVLGALYILILKFTALKSGCCSVYCISGTSQPPEVQYSPLFGSYWNWTPWGRTLFESR